MIVEVTLDEFKALVANGESRRFVTHELFGDGCWLFEQRKLIAPNATYKKLKADIADLLEIRPQEIAIVGSAKFGWSMSPVKRVRTFGPTTSDIDSVFTNL